MSGFIVFASSGQSVALSYNDLVVTILMTHRGVLAMFVFLTGHGAFASRANMKETQGVG